MVSGVLGTGTFQTAAVESRLNSALMFVVALAGMGVEVGSCNACKVELVATPAVVVG